MRTAWKSVSCKRYFPVFILLWGLIFPGWCFGVVLNDLEKYYIETKGRVTVCVDPDWIPFEHINENGEYEGIAADLLKLVSERTGLKFELVKTKSWEESIEFSKNKKCQILSFLNKTPKREEWLTFSEPLFTDSNVFITREEHPFISSPGGLVDESIVLPRGTSMEEFFRRDYPNLKVIITETEEEAVQMVSNKKADMTMRSLVVAAYTIKKEGLFNLKISGQVPDYTNKLRVGVANKDLILLDIINKGIQTITVQDRGAIVNKHVSINVQTVTDYSLLFKIAGTLAFIIVLSTVWIFQLKKHNEELAKISQTDTLTGLPNRLRLNTVFESEFLRSKRYGRSLSVIMIDVDHFKRVNDECSHVVGDKVLIEIGKIARSHVRSTDTLGRWGGEEFLVVCPETDHVSALLVASRICDAVRFGKFSSGKVQTVSAGVSTISPDDTVDTLLLRADAAMYQAKQNGRDQVKSL